MGSDKSCEGVATSLRFPSQSGSFTPGHYGKEAGPPDGQPDSPIKASPVSERIKALEALAAKKESDFRSDGSFSHYKERNYEKSPTEVHKSPTEKMTPSVQKKRSSTDQSPESPFEVLGDLRQVNEFEETEEWMKAHLPPVPKLDDVDLIKDTLASDHVTSKEKNSDIITPDAVAAFAGVPDAFMDSPFKAPTVKDDCDPKKQSSVEEESEFDLSFLPTAFMWDQQDKSGVQAQANTESELPASPAPPAGFGSSSPPCSLPESSDVRHSVLGDDKATLTGDLEHPEASEAESSGESDETVIEDSVAVPESVSAQSSDPAVSNGSATPDVPTEVAPPPKSERKLMQVPTINVIETDEPNYSEEDMEMELEDDVYGVLKDSTREAPESSEAEPDNSITTPPKAYPLEMEFVEGYSPPSSPVDSDAEYSPKHKPCLPEVSQEAMAKPEALPNPAVSEDSTSEVSQIQAEKSRITSSKVSDELLHFIGTNEEVDFPDNDDDWSDDGQGIVSSKTDVGSKEPVPYIEPKVENTNEKAYAGSFSKTSFMQDEIYDRQSFDYEFDAFSPLDNLDNKGMNNAKERFLSDASEIQTEKLNASTAHGFQEDAETLDDFSSLNYNKASSKQVAQASVEERSQDQFSLFQSESLNNKSERDLTKKVTNDNTSDNMTNGNALSAQKADSAVQQGTITAHHEPKTSNPESTETSGLSSGPTDSFVEFMRECLKSKQDDEADGMHQDVPSKAALPPSQPTPTMVMDLEQEQLTISALKELGSSQDEEASSTDTASSNASSLKQSSSVANPPSSQSSRVYDNTYSKEVEAIDEWVAEAYHLAEHVLTAILTHLSGNASFF